MPIPPSAAGSKVEFESFELSFETCVGFSGHSWGTFGNEVERAGFAADFHTDFCDFEDVTGAGDFGFGRRSASGSRFYRLRNLARDRVFLRGGGRSGIGTRAAMGSYGRVLDPGGGGGRRSIAD